MTDEQRVKEVWPDAKVICGPENCNGHQIVIPISGDGWGAEFGAWADAASRLPKAPPVAEAAPQTFEEWRDTLEFTKAAEALYVAGLDLGNVSDFALSVWNAAKASSPAVAGGESETPK